MAFLASPASLRQHRKPGRQQLRRYPQKDAACCSQGWSTQTPSTVWDALAEAPTPGHSCRTPQRSPTQPLASSWARSLPTREFHRHCQALYGQHASDQDKKPQVPLTCPSASLWLRSLPARKFLAPDQCPIKSRHPEGARQLMLTILAISILKMHAGWSPWPLYLDWCEH